INIDQCRWPEVGQQSRIDAVVEVQEEVCLPKDCLCGGLCHADVLVRAAATVCLPLAPIEDELSAESVAFHPLDEHRLYKGIVVPITAAVEALQPVDFTPQLPQTLHILHIHPEMPAPLREVHDVDRRDDDGGHEGSPLGT